MCRVSIALTALVLLCFGIAPRASAMGEEDFGNKPLSDANYKEWPGLMPVINDTHRVYHYWVNGNEQFFYSGDTAALNAALVELARADKLGSEVVLRPGPGLTHSFDGTKKVSFTWDLHIVGGIAGAMAKRGGGEGVWSKHPVLTVQVGDAIDLAKLVVPRGLIVHTLADVKTRTCEGFKSAEQDTRGWTCGILAELDHRDPASAAAIAKMLDDPVDWVKLNAVGALQSMGATARPYLTRIRALKASAYKPLAEAAGQAAEAISKASDDPAQSSAFVAALRRIDLWVATSRLRK